MKEIKIGNKIVGGKNPVYIIAEAGINHNGDLKLAKEMIEVAKESGVDAIKFQLFKASDVIQDKKEIYEYESQGKIFRESQYEMFKRYELSGEDMNCIADYCRKKDIVFFATPQNISDLKVLLEIGVPAIKVGSDDLTHIEMLKEYASHGLPLILSTGMAYLSEIDEALQAVMPINEKIVLLHCVSMYPAAFKDANMIKIQSLSKIYSNVIIGFSDHTLGTTAGIMAVTLGAKVYERHFTLDKNLYGPDHRFSVDFKELKTLVRQIREAEEALGSPELKPTKTEEGMRLLCRRSIVAERDININEIISNDNLSFRRPGKGIPPKYMPFLLNRKTKRSIKKGEVILLEDVY